HRRAQGLPDRHPAHPGRPEEVPLRRPGGDHRPDLHHQQDPANPAAAGLRHAQPGVRRAGGAPDRRSGHRYSHRAVHGFGAAQARGPGGAVPVGGRALRAAVPPGQPAGELRQQGDRQAEGERDAAPVAAEVPAGLPDLPHHPALTQVALSGSPPPGSSGNPPLGSPGSPPPGLPGSPPPVSFARTGRGARLLGGGRSGTVISTVSTLVVLGALAATFLLAPGARAAEHAFFRPQHMWSSFIGNPQQGYYSVGAAIWLNIRMFVVAEVLILVLALLIALIRQSVHPALFPIRILATGYVDFFRGVPLILVIFAIGLGVPALSLPVVSAQSNAVYGVTALVLSYSAYVSEVYRA